MRKADKVLVHFRRGLMIAGVAAAYYVTARLGLLLDFQNTNASPVWPPSGIAFAAMLFLGYRIWPGIAIGTFLANAVVFFSNQAAEPVSIVATSFFIAIGNTSEALLGVFLFKFLIDSAPNPFDETRNAFKFVLVALVMCLIAATVGASSLLLFGIISRALYETVWLTWWLGDIGGILVLTPLFIVFRHKLIYVSWTTARFLEALLFAFFLYGTSETIFGKFFQIGSASYPLTFTLIPFVIWAAFRFGQRGTMVTILIISISAIWGTVHGFGPFVGANQNESLLQLQTFIITIVLTGLFSTTVLTEQKKGEEVLRRNEEKLHLILETANDAFIGMNEKGAVVDWNRQAEVIFGWPREEVMGHSLADIIIPVSLREAHRKGLEHFMATGEGRMLNKRIEINALHRDGHEFLIELTIWPIRFGGSYHFNAVLRDITERKQVEEKRAQLLKELATANQELSDFAHVTSHDLKAPLRGIGILAEWFIKDYRERVDEKGKELLSSIIEKVSLMNALIDGVLEYSSVGRSKIKLKPADLNEMVKEVVAMIVPPKNITITIENELPTIECEQVRIRQVFQNLIANAIKYMDKPNGEIKVACVPDGNYWKFSVSDNGPGINEKYFTKIFQMFQTLQQKGQSKSTGIGLALAKKVIEQTGGKIWVESKVGEGASFFFTLPRDIRG